MGTEANGRGLTFSLADYDALNAFEHGELLWSTQFQRLILESEPARLGTFLPQARFVPGSEGRPGTVTFYMYDKVGNEVAAGSVPAGNRIPSA